jgi:hypothetical protein
VNGVRGLSAIELVKVLHKIPTLLTTWVRCGKPTCRCNAGQLHGPYHALQWRDGVIQRRRYVRADDLPEVRAILENRRDERLAERLALSQSLQSWRALRRLAHEYEARVREGEEL